MIDCLPQEMLAEIIIAVPRNDWQAVAATCQRCQVTLAGIVGRLAGPAKLQCQLAHDTALQDGTISVEREIINLVGKMQAGEVACLCSERRLRVAIMRWFILARSFGFSLSARSTMSILAKYIAKLSFGESARVGAIIMDEVLPELAPYKQDPSPLSVLRDELILIVTATVTTRHDWAANNELEFANNILSLMSEGVDADKLLGALDVVTAVNGEYARDILLSLLLMSYPQLAMSVQQLAEIGEYIDAMKFGQSRKCLTEHLLKRHPHFFDAAAAQGRIPRHVNMGFIGFINPISDTDEGEKCGLIRQIYH